MLHIIQNTTIVNDIFFLENLSVNCILLKRERERERERERLILLKKRRKNNSPDVGSIIRPVISVLIKPSSVERICSRKKVFVFTGNHSTLK